MMRAACLVSVFAAGVIATAPASAQLVPKQIVLDAFGQCLVKQSPRLAARLLETPFSTKAEHDQAMTLAKANDACLRGRPVLSMQVGAIRGAVAEYALVSDEKLLDAARALPAAAPERPPIADGRAFVIAYATCIAHADPAHTVALIETPVASAEERSAFIGYGDTLKACMPLGAQYQANITDIRNHLASALYMAARARAGA